MNELTQITSENIINNFDTDKLLKLSKEIHVNTYQSKISEFNDDNITLNKTIKLGDSPYILEFNTIKRKEMNINIIITKDKLKLGHNFMAFIFLKKNENEAKYFELKEENEDDNFIYFHNKIPWDYLEHSNFKIKGFLYDFYFE